MPCLVGQSNTDTAEKCGSKSIAATGLTLQEDCFDIVQARIWNYPSTDLFPINFFALLQMLVISPDIKPRWSNCIRTFAGTAVSSFALLHRCLTET